MIIKIQRLFIAGALPPESPQEIKPKIIHLVAIILWLSRSYAYSHHGQLNSIYGRLVGCSETICLSWTFFGRLGSLGRVVGFSWMANEGRNDAESGAIANDYKCNGKIICSERLIVHR